MAKPNKRTKASSRPSYKKILKQQEQQELKGDSQEAMIDQIAALEALLGGGSPEPEPEVAAPAVEAVDDTPKLSPEEQERLDKERAEREEERVKERTAREEERNG